MPFTPDAENTLGVRVEAQGTDEFGESIDGASQSLGGMRTAALGAAGVLAGSLALAIQQSISQAAEFEEAMVDVQRVTSETTADELTESLQTMASEMPIARSELTTIAETAGRLGISGSENIGQFTREISKLSVATELTADDAANDFARLSNALGEPIENIDQMGAAVNTLSQTTAASTADIVDSMGRAAPAAATLGVEFEDLAAIQATLVSSGMRVERAGTRMNRALTKLSQEAASVADAVGMGADEFNRLIENDTTAALETYLEHLASIESKQAQVNEATEIFGSAGAKAVLTLANNVDELDQATQDSAASFEEATSVNKEYEEASTTLNAKLQITKNRLEEIATTQGTEVQPATKDTIGVFNDFLSVVNDVQGANQSYREEVMRLVPDYDVVANATDALTDSQKAYRDAVRDGVTVTRQAARRELPRYAQATVELAEKSDDAATSVADLGTSVDNLKSGVSSVRGGLTTTSTRMNQVADETDAAKRSMVGLTGAIQVLNEDGTSEMDSFSTKTQDFLNETNTEIEDMLENLVAFNQLMSALGEQDAQGGTNANERNDLLEAARSRAGDVEGAASGGFIEEGGLLRVHAGERVVPAEIARPPQSGASPGGGVSINRVVIHANSHEGGQAAASGFEQELAAMNIRDTSAL